MRGRAVAVAFSVLVSASIAYTGARVTSGVGLSGSVDSGVGAGISTAMVVLTVDGPRSPRAGSRRFAVL